MFSAGIPFLIRSFYQFDLGDRPVSENSLPEYLIPADKSIRPEAGVQGIVPIVTHDKITVLRNFVGTESPCCGFLCIHIFQRFIRTVDIDPAVYDLHCLSGKPDDPFDEQLALVVRVAEDDDIEPLGVREGIGKTIPYDAVPRHDCILHGAGRDLGVHDQKIVCNYGDSGGKCDRGSPLQEFFQK